MSNALVSCASCHRHVRVADASCPFCGASVVGIEPVRRPLRRRGLTRSAILLGTVLGAAACGGGSSAEPSAEETSGGEESNENAGESGDEESNENAGESGDDVTGDEEAAPDDVGGPVAMYGAPAPN